MGEAFGWGALGASSLVIGVLLAFARKWPPALIGLVMAFGAGALISAVSFELTEEGLDTGSGMAVAIGLAAGALTYFFLDRLIQQSSNAAGPSAGSTESNEGPALALGAFLDGIPEQLVLGIGLAGGEAVSVSLLIAIFISNLPEGIAAANEMEEAGTPRSRILGLFAAIAAVCTLACVAGYAAADAMSVDMQAGVNGFAAGALLVMLIDSMIPDAVRKAGLPSGLVTVLGYALATWLSSL
jgi:ZIP family zinc transporter